MNVYVAKMNRLRKYKETSSFIYQVANPTNK